MGSISATPAAREYLRGKISLLQKRLSRLALWFGLPALAIIVGVFVMLDFEVEPQFVGRGLAVIALFFAMPYISASPLYLAKEKWSLSEEKVEIRGGFHNGTIKWKEIQSFAISEVSELVAHVELRIERLGKGGVSIICRSDEPGLSIFRNYAAKNGIVEQDAAPQIGPRW